MAAGGGTVFARAPFYSPSELLPLLDAGARVRHLSSGWALVEIAATDVTRLPSRSEVIAPVRDDYRYAWTTLPVDLDAGAELVWTWRGYGLVGMPTALAWRLPSIGAPHHSAPLADYAREALTDGWNFPAPSATPAAVEVAKRLHADFDMDRWTANVEALADNQGLRSRFAFRVANAEIFDGTPQPDDAADVAAAWITAELHSYGYDVAADTFLHTRFATLNQKFADFHMTNVVAEKPGVGPNRNRVLLLTAHYDSIASRTDGWDTDWRDLPAPGADDNASGVATVLEAARLFVAVDFDFTVRFVLFSGEELGLFGSRHFARAARERGEDIVGVINIDMIGHDADGILDLHVVGNHQSEWLLREADALIGQLDTTLALFPAINPDLVFSDHASFWAQGYSALAFSEEDALDTPEFSPVYHSTEDTPDTINAEYASEAASAIIAAAAAIARPVTGTPPTSAPDDEDVRVIAASAFPNPFVAGPDHRVSIQYQLSRAAEVRLDVYAMDGARVFSARGVSAAAQGGVGLNPPVLWDGRDHAGARVAPGLYVAHIVATDADGGVSRRTLRLLVAADPSVLDSLRGSSLNPGP